jgi:hypothetical protein
MITLKMIKKVKTEAMLFSNDGGIIILNDYILHIFHYDEFVDFQFMNNSGKIIAYYSLHINKDCKEYINSEFTRLIDFLNTQNIYELFELAYEELILKTI